MSNHPYRQRIPQPSGNNSGTSSPSTSQYHSPMILSPNQSPQIRPNQDNHMDSVVTQTTPYPMNNAIPSHLHNFPQNVHRNQNSQGSIPQDLLHDNRQFNGSPSPSHQSNPSNDISTPPPIFNNSSVPIPSITSPQTNSLSATSSVTNFQLPPNGDAELGNLGSNLVLSKPHKHDRSVSSTSSFHNDSTIDFNQSLLTQYLGDNSSNLMPRMKTIELYRKNAQKSNDPTVLFQYAQYMLQTALLVDKDGSQSGNSPLPSSVENSPARGPQDSSPHFKKSHNKSKSTQSFDLSNISEDSIDDKRLKKSLLKEATIYLKKLSDKGYVEAQYLLGDAYSSGAIGKVDNKESFVLFQSAAKHGHVESAYRTSYCYEEGLGTGRDARKAIDYLKMAASKNHPAAMYKLGVYSFHGRMGLGHDVNTKKMGIKWLERASSIANELIAAAPFELGKIYFEGFKDILIQDKKYALELYSQAAALGHIESSAILGHHYEVGDIVPQDSNLSIHYYTQAALGGDPGSMLAMCAWYLVGSDPYLPKDENESFEWAKRAAMCELPKGQFALANFYDKGIGCVKNPTEAQKWYIKAAENGDEKALTRINDKELVAKLSKKAKKNKVITKKESHDKDCVIV